MFIKPCRGLLMSLFDKSRKNPVTGVVQPHWGIDYGNHADNTIVASASGTVRIAVNSTTGFGKYIIITHINGWETVYAHLASINVKVGQKVSQGQLIGVKGTTGNSTGIHLHFEISRGQWSNSYKYHVDPALYIDDPDVRHLQQSLNKLGYSLTVDGIYGAETTKAVLDYQKKNGLTDDGVAGPLTVAAIEKSIAAIITATTNNQNNENGVRYLNLADWQKKETAEVYKFAREKGIFSSAEHEKNVLEGKMTVDQAIFLMTVIAGAALNDGNRIQ
ncbi:peptidoglycan DD-metalloendopeptidase family protein [Sporosarcina sp. HYO08]|uniref:peptidoglycan DD-metalloendopeptidase family protein n=1 Tax=Sporosarcina sp. HYO08 TaxID=1759557 RepID=UPI00079A4512|nr:peptidoglycan DD-metalloendopeptidase family protein [Sporosarcina sp. HYO08]KXH81984.1 hypothetical protein AU377_06935 [Sporosarcina sp. HYO08]